MRKFVVIFLLLAFCLGFSKETGFTQQDRERLIRLETTLKVFMEQTDKRLKELGEDMNRRFQQVDKRFEELREDMNKRFEQVDNRFEQVSREIDRLVQIMIAVFAGQLGLVGAVIAFAWWDRRTIIREAKRQTFDELERETKPEKLRRLLNVLREKAKTDAELREILKREGLL